MCSFRLSGLINSVCYVLSHFSRIWLFLTPMDCRPPGFSVHGILQARLLDWVAMRSSRAFCIHLLKFYSSNTGHGQPVVSLFSSVLNLESEAYDYDLPTLLMSSVTLGFSSMWTETFQMYKLGLGRSEEPEIKLPKFAGSWRKQGSSRITSTSASLTILNLLIVWITMNCGKF